MPSADQSSFNGIDAIVYAAEDSGVKLAAGVPGFPINGIFTALQNNPSIKADWQYNEKIAYEMAMGASACGDRSLVISKHVGINIMSDPMIISVTHGIGAGIVVIVGDDIGAGLSQNEQDSRWYGKLAEIPVFDPATPGTLYESILKGFEMSETISAPVLVRVTESVLNSNGPIDQRRPDNPHKKMGKDAWHYTMYGKHQKYLAEGWSIAEIEANGSEMNICELSKPAMDMHGHVGIISSGYASVIVTKVLEKVQASHLSLTQVNPIPRDLINNFMSMMDLVLVCEEGAPFIEEHISSAKVKGRLTNHLPRAGVLSEEEILRGIKTIDSTIYLRGVEPETLESRGYAKSHCPGCPFIPVYEVIKSLNVPVASDVGCSIYTANPPFQMVNVACSLGSPVSVACGFDQKGVAMLGDFGLLHTGMQSLLNAKLHGYNVLVVLFMNEQAAMTGGQKVPDVTGIVKSVFEDDCIIADMGVKTSGEIADELKSLMEAGTMKVYLVRGKCKK